MTFQEKVEPLSKDEKGQLRGGFNVVDMGQNSGLRIRNGDECVNKNCPSDTKNQDGCENTNCSKCNCGCPSVTNPYSNFPCSGIGHLYD